MSLQVESQTPLPWLVEAFKYNNLKEVPGKANNPTIVKWLNTLKAWWSDDATPWCGTFVAWCLREADRAIPKHWYRALAYNDYGTKLSSPAYGCIATIDRKGGGHVFFVIGVTEKGDIVGFGGNQSDAVNLRVFPRSSIRAYVWPAFKSGALSRPAGGRYKLPKYNSKNLTVVGSMA